VQTDESRESASELRYPAAVQDGKQRQERSDPESHTQDMEEDGEAAEDLGLGRACMSAHGQRQSQEPRPRQPDWSGREALRPSQTSQAEDERRPLP